jgi:hypothetical protein
MKLFCLLLFIVTNVTAADLMICNGEYALCAASPATRDGDKKITVMGKEFAQGKATCPVLTGKSIANGELMHNSCKAPAGKVWSLFGMPPVSSFPKAPSWAVADAPSRTWTLGETPTTGMSNMWSFLCTKTKVVNGVQLAECLGPLQESPFTNNAVKPGQLGFTQAPGGATYPVGGNAPQK